MGNSKVQTSFKRWTAIFIAIILLSSFCAQFISSSGGTVKISNITLDIRAAKLDADLYYPAGTSEEDKLPAIVVNHGGAVSKGVVRGIAEELSRRGFVVLNVNAYANGLSEAAAGADASGGVLDTVEYLRTLKYVDTTRIGVVGHSAGSTRVGTAGMLDAGVYTLNDLLVNILYDTFGVKLAQDEIYQDANALAAKYLSGDQLTYYEALKSNAAEKYNTRINAVCVLGTSGKSMCKLETVQVAGFDVSRNYQFNLAAIDGQFDPSRVEFPTMPYVKESWHTGEKNVEEGQWYVLDDASLSSKTLGNYKDVTILNSSELAQAFENRAVRMFTTNSETHSKNFFSAAAASDIVSFFTQAFNYNNGPLGDASAHPVAALNIVYLWRALLNCIAMFAMIGLLVTLAGLFTQSKFFSPCIVPMTERKPFSKKLYWIIGLLNIVLAFLAIYLANNAESGPNNLIIPPSAVFPLGFASDTVLKFVFLLGGFTLILLVAVLLFQKKSTGETGISRLNLKMRPAALLKSLLLAIILLVIGYVSLSVIMSLFNQDFRLWSTSFTVMKAEYWPSVFPYALIVLPVYLICSAMTNYTIREDIPGWLDDTIAVVMGSAGVWLCGLANILIAMFSYNGTLFASFIMTYSVMLFVPIVTLINRKIYKITNSIWLGALVSALLFGWSVTAAAGFGSASQSFISIFFGL